MYEAIKQSINGEFNSSSNPNSISEAYEQLYRWTSRLADMDDFNTDILKAIQTEMSGGLKFEDAFKTVIDEKYEFADYSYFKDAVVKFHDSLVETLDNALATKSPSNYWNKEIDWMAQHAVITVDGNDYTIDQLKNKLDNVEEV